MNRPLKFRVWDKDRRTLSEVKYIRWLADGSMKCVGTGDEESPGPRVMAKRAVLMQYTGLKDKLGREIYEGDILEMSQGPFHSRGVMEFEEGFFGVNPQPGQPHFVNGHNIPINEKQVFDFRSWEVVGNIWEQSELLEDN